MRRVALVLVLSLLAPAASTAYCELSCLDALPREAAATPGDHCHDGNAADTNVPAVSAGATMCHGEHGGQAALAEIVTPAVVALAAAPAVATQTPAQPAAPVRGLTAPSRPPDLARISAPLRI